MIPNHRPSTSLPPAHQSPSADRNSAPTRSVRQPVRRVLLLLLTLLACMGLAGVNGAAAADEEPGPLDTRAVDAYLEGQIDAGLPGAAVAITKGDRVQHVRGYGHDSTGAKITGETRFRIASLSKSFTALAVMQLVEAGRIRLDDPVVSHLPTFAPDDAKADQITVQHLLSQTSGMADRGFPEISLPQPSSLAEAVTRLDSAHLVADPGARWNYHNPNYQVAARLVEVVSGLSFEDYLRRHVFDPLGMAASTTTETDDQQVAGLADGYTFAYGQPVSAQGPGYFVAGSGGVVSTASDLAGWLVMQNSDGRAVDGTRLLSTEGLAIMHSPAEPGGYALGWDTDGPSEDPTEISHGGTQYTFSAHQTLLPDSGYGVAVLFNSTSALGLEQTAIIEGLTDIVEGNAPTGPKVSSATVDWILSALTILALALGIRGVLRSQRWVTRRARTPAWRVALRLVPHVALIALAAVFPGVAGFLFGGRDVTWLSAVYGWVALVTLVTVAALASLATTGARATHLLHRRRPGTAPLQGSR